MSVSERFDGFIAKLKLTDSQRIDGTTKQQGVRECLNKHYYDITSNSQNSMLVGSWGKDTEVRPPRDIDVLFKLPDSAYWRFESRFGNRQSQVLQEVKEVLGKTYLLTRMRGDGQVVVVPFTSYAIEVLPAFQPWGSQYKICDTNGGGSYRSIDLVAEINNMSNSNRETSGNTRDLIRMLKRWQEVCNVPLKSFQLELLAVDFLKNWEYRGKTSVYYDWMVRDFLKFLIGRANSFVSAPGTYEIINLGNFWKSKAESAYARAVKACEYAADKFQYLANDEWDKIFGQDIKLI